MAPNPSFFEDSDGREDFNSNLSGESSFGSAAARQPFSRSFDIYRPCEQFVHLFSVRITDYFIATSCARSYTLYTIRFNDFGDAMSVTRRYSDFVLLDRLLRNSGYNVPIALPEKRMFGNLEPSFVAQRYRGLKIYLEKLLANSSSSQLAIICCFLGLPEEVLLYLQLITADSLMEKTRAIDALFRFLILPIKRRGAFLAELLTYPLGNFTHLSEAEPCGLSKNSNSRLFSLDNRLGHEMVYMALLDALKSSESETTCQIAGIFVYMYYHLDHLRNVVMDGRSVHYIVKAIARLLLDRALTLVSFDYDGIPNRAQELKRTGAGTVYSTEQTNVHGSASSTTLAGAKHPNTRPVASVSLAEFFQIPIVPSQCFWYLVVAFVIDLSNQIPDVVRSYVEDVTCIEKLNRLAQLPNSIILYPFAAWILWLASFETDVGVILPKVATNDLIKRLFKHGTSTVKALCGAVISSLLHREWFDKEAAPRALGSLVVLMENKYVVDGIDVYYLGQLFNNYSLPNFTSLLKSDLDADVKRFLLQLVHTFLLRNFQPNAEPLDLNMLATRRHAFQNTASLEHLLLGDDYTSETCASGVLSHDIDEALRAPVPQNVNEFSKAYGSIFASFYDVALVQVSKHLSPAIYEIMSGIAMLAETCATCLLFLPWHNENTDKLFTLDFGPLLGQDGQLFVNTSIEECLNFNPSLMDHQEVNLNDEPVGSGAASVVSNLSRASLKRPQYSEDGTVINSLGLTREFIEARLELADTFVQAVKCNVELLLAVHTNNNASTSEALHLARKVFASTEQNVTCDVTAVESAVHVESKPVADVFDDFSFDAQDSLPTIGPPDLLLVNHLDIVKYCKEMDNYQTFMDVLVTVVKFVVGYHRLCQARLYQLESEIEKFQRLHDQITPKDFLDLSQLCNEFQSEYNVLQELKNSKSKAIQNLQESITLKGRLQDLIKGNAEKIDATKVQVERLQTKIRTYPQFKRQADEKVQTLEKQCKDLEAKASETTAEIIALQTKMMDADKNKQELSDEIAKLLEIFSLVNQRKEIVVDEFKLEIGKILQGKQQHLDYIVNLLSPGQTTLDASESATLAEGILERSTSLQSQLEHIGREGLQLKINDLNKQLKTSEQRLYSIKAEINDIKRTSNINVSALQDTLDSQTLLLESLESSNNNHLEQVEKIHVNIATTQTKLSEIKQQCYDAKAKVINSKAAVSEAIVNQRQVRIATFAQLVTLELLAKRIWLLYQQADFLISLKQQLIGDVLQVHTKNEHEARVELIAILKEAAAKFKATANFFSTIVQEEAEQLASEPLQDND